MFVRPMAARADQQRGELTGRGDQKILIIGQTGVTSRRSNVVTPCRVWRKIQSNQVVILVARTDHQYEHDVINL